MDVINALRQSEVDQEGSNVLIPATTSVINALRQSEVDQEVDRAISETEHGDQRLTAIRGRSEGQ